MHFPRMLTAVAVSLVLPVLSPEPAVAQDCNSLWYQRNAIYAAAGHCFNTQKGIAVFGRNCFPPYGQLNGGQQRQVNRIVAQERRFGC